MFQRTATDSFLGRSESKFPQTPVYFMSDRLLLLPGQYRLTDKTVRKLILAAPIFSDTKCQALKIIYGVKGKVCDQEVLSS